jgi:SPP1 family predicted phage head-tail adaptor
MRGGRLRRRVTLMMPSVSRDTTGAAKHAYTDVQTVWAGVEPLRGQEFHEAAKHSSEAEIRVVIRHRDDVAPTWRLKYGTRTLEIVAVIPVMEQRREIQLMCRELQSGEPN